MKFDGSGSSDPDAGDTLTYIWDFGDGSTTNTGAAGVTHTYITPGTNTVKLTATGPAGTDTLNRFNYIVAFAQLIIVNLRLSGPDVVVSFTSAPGSGREEYVEIGIVTSYPTPDASTTA